MKKKTVTVLAIEYSKRVCDPQPELIDRMDVRGLVMSAYRSGYNKAHSEHVKRITNIVELKLSDIDSPVFYFALTLITTILRTHIPTAI